jgi:hypothetical protein
LREQVRKQIIAEHESRRFVFPWAMSGRIINAVGTLAVVGVLAAGALTVFQTQSTSQLARATPIKSASPYNEIAVTTPNWSDVPPLPLLSQAIKPTPEPKLSSLGDTIPPLPHKEEAQLAGDNQKSFAANGGPQVGHSSPSDFAEADTSPSLPGGLIAFAVFNPDAEKYETHLIKPDGSNHTLFPLAGISEPALRQNGSHGYQMAYRSWGEPTTPRSLVSSNLLGDQANTLTDYWEDAQPDWSPTENRIIFASARESDRYWRLYTAWGDGSAEFNLRREGRSPTFAPDGHRFAFESCDSYVSREQCGLWQADLDNSEYEAEPFLLDPLAQSPDWSPVGEEVVYMANPADNWDLYVVNTNGKNVRRLTNDPAIEGLPTWSPDGQWVAFLSDREGQWGIWLLHLDTGQTQSLFTFEPGHLTPPKNPLYGERQWWDEQLSWSN